MAANTQLNISPIMQLVIEQTLPSFQGGTIPAELIQTINDAETIETAVGGEDIFHMMNNAIAQAQSEVLIQTFAYDRKIPAVKELRQILEDIVARKEEERQNNGNVQPLRLYLLIDERGPIAHLAFTGKRSQSWPVSPDSVGLFNRPGLVEVYVDVYSHNTFAGNHAKTVVVDGRVLMITGANFQSSNYGHTPAHDAGWLIKGDVARSARKDFAVMWADRKNPTPASNLVEQIPAPLQEPLNHPITLLFLTRLAMSTRSFNSLDNPQNCAFFSGLNAAERIVRIATPNLNAPFIMNSLVKFLNERNGKVQLLLGQNFNDRREATLFMGGGNQAAVDALFHNTNPDNLENLDIRWFSLNGRDSVRGNVAGACHLKYMSIDDQLTFIGNTNLDVISTTYLHEANLVIDDAETTQGITRMVFEDVFTRSIPARPSENTKERFLEAVGYRPWRETLATKYSVNILEVTEEGQGYNTTILSRPENFQFLPGQYIEIRSGGLISKATNKSPAILAIASGSQDGTLEITARGSSVPWNPNHGLKRRQGRTLEVTGPLGTSFPMELVTPGKPLYLLGGGSGLTVIRSLYRSVPEGVNPIILYSAQYENSLFYRDEINQWRSQGHFISLTKEEKVGFENGRITDQINRLDIPQESLAFVCGPTPLIEATVQSLVDKGISIKQIFVSLPVGATQGGPVFRADDPRMTRTITISEPSTPSCSSSSSSSSS